MDPIFSPTTPFSPNWGSQPLVKLRPNGARYNGGLYWHQPMGGTYHCPTQQYHRRRLGAPSPKKHAEHRARCGVSLPSCLQTFHIHKVYSNRYSCLHFPDTILDCHLITPAFSTPAIWYRVFHSRAFQSPPYDTQPNACRLVPIPRYCFAVSIYNA